MLEPEASRPPYTCKMCATEHADERKPPQRVELYPECVLYMIATRISTP